MDRSPALWTAALIVLLVALLTGTVLRARELSVKRQFNHDEAISYIAATGHEDQYLRATGAVGREAPNGALTGRWLPAARWKQLMEADGFWGFGAVSSGLAHTDTHPPLYFWVLHVFVAFAGVHLKDGIILNLGITLATGIALFLLARRLLGDPLEAALVVLVWDVSPPMLTTSIIARQYDLYALFVVLFALLLVRAIDAERPFRALDFVALTLATTAGVLTHYQFVVVALGGAAYAAAFLLRRDQRRLLAVYGSFAAGVPLFLLAAPHFYQSVRRQSDWQVSTMTLHDLGARVHAVGSGVYPWFGLLVNDLRAAPGVTAAATRPFWGPLGDGLAVAVVGAVFVLAGVGLGIALALPRSRRPVRAYLRRVDRTGVVRTLGLLAAVVVHILLMYVTFRSPWYAMHDRYVAPMWTMLAFVPVLAARLLIGRWRYVAVAALVVLVMLPASLGRLHTLRHWTPDLGHVLTAAHHVVIDAPDRGNVSRLVYFLPDDKPVFVAWQAQLRQRPQAWLPKLQANDLYLSVPLYGNTASSLAETRRLVGTRLEMRLRRLGVNGVGRMFVLKPKRGGVAAP